MKNKILFCGLIAIAAMVYAPRALAGSATVTWSANSESDLAGYKIYYGTSPRTGTDPKTCGQCGYSAVVNAGKVTSYNFSSLTDGQTYYFSVTAYDTSNNESAFSSEVSKQTISLPAISNLVGSNTTATTTQISWQTNVNTNGQIFYGTSAVYGFQSALLDNNPKTTSHTFILTSLTPSTTYHFKVTSVDGLANSTSSPDFTFTTLALPPPPAPSIGSFTANPSSITMGNSSVLSWTTTNSTSLSLDNSIGSVTGQTSKSVSPAQTTTYTLTATGSGGTATKSVTLTVGSSSPPAPTSTAPSISSFTASLSAITAGQSSTLSWSVTGSPAPTLTLDNAIGEVSSVTSKSVSPSANTTYTLTATNSAGSATAQVTVNVSAAAPAPAGGGGGGGGGGGSSGGGGGASPVTVYIPPAPAVSGQPINGLTTSQSNALRLINNQGTFYLVMNNTLHGITNPGMLTTYGFSFNQAKTATTQDMALPQGTLLTPNNGSLVKSVQDQTVYLISNQQRYGFTSAKVFTDLGFKFSSVLVVTNPELQALPKTSNISSGSSQHLAGLDINRQGTVYWVGTDSQLHAYPSLDIYNSWHIANDFTRVVPANSADLSLPVGAEVPGRSVN